MTLQEKLAQIEDELRGLHDAAGENPLDEEQQKRWDELVADRSGTERAIKAEGERRSVVASLASRTTETGDAARAAAPAVHRQADPHEMVRSGEWFRAKPRDLAEANVRALEALDVPAEHVEQVQKHLRRHLTTKHTGQSAGLRAREAQEWAANLLARSDPDYLSAFSKLVTGQEHFLTDDEKRAAMAVGTNTAGGFLVPTHLDPTLILTNSGVSNSIRAMSRQVTLVGGANTWKGVTTAGATASWDAELTEVSDDTPAVASVSVPVFSAKALVMASIEAMEDIPGLASDILMILQDARDRLEAAAHATGNGTTAPTGIFTALDANTNVELISTTANTIGLVDLQTVYRSVPVRWRGSSTWLMNPLFHLNIQALGTAVSASYSGDVRDEPTARLLGRPVVESDEAPSTQTTTANDNAIILGDFSNFVIVDKPGSTAIEYIPHLFNTSNNLPDGRRGWYMHFRNGSDSVNDLAFRLLQEKTSA